MKEMILFGVLIALIFVALVRAGDDPHALCRALADTKVSHSGRYAVWDTDAKTWRDIPNDLNGVNIDFLPVNEDKNAGYYLKYSPSKNELWIFPFWSLENDGTGSHDLCPVIVYKLKED